MWRAHLSAEPERNLDQPVWVDLDVLHGPVPADVQPWPLGEYCTQVVIVSALSGECTFGDLGAVTLSVDGEYATAATATLDAGTSERTMLLAEIYRRGEQWRVRAIGQGYDDGLAELATRYGVVVD